MIINNFSALKNVPLINKGVNLCGARMQNSIKADTISFTGKVKSVFASQKEALEYYKKIAQDINQSLEDDDDITAFETLGYDIDADFDTDKITINGDYKPYFEAITVGKTGNKKPCIINYSEAGIDEERLLQNVEKIKGKKFVPSSFVPGQDYVIDKNIVYPDSVGKRLDKLMKQRSVNIKEALKNGDTKTALEILGYEVSSDKDKKLTITGDYSTVLYSSEGKTKILDDYGIDENRLLTDVVKIEGEALFGPNIAPDHYIDTKDVKMYENGYRRTYAVKKEIAAYNPEYQAKIKTVNKMLEQGDNFSALQELGYSIERDENGKITINGSYKPEILASYNCSFSYSECGIDEDALLKDVSKITGNFSGYLSNIKKIDKDMIICGIATYKNPEIFSEFLSTDSVSKLYEGISPDVIESFVKFGAIIPSIRTPDDSYFKAVEGKNKEFLDGIISRRDEILTPKEIQEKYYVAPVTVNNALRNRILIPYGIDLSEYNTRLMSADSFMFDINDERNAEAIKKFNMARNARLKRQERITEGHITGEELIRACLRNRVRYPKQDCLSSISYPIDALELFGYGTRADIMANCKLRVDSYEIKKYLMENDKYNINRADIMDILLNSRHNNPGSIKFTDLQSKLGKNKQEFNKAVVDNKINVITENPFRLCNGLADYYIDLTDEKNLEFLKTVQNEEFQTWLTGRLDSYKQYREENDRAYEKFKHQAPPSEQDIYRQIEQELKEAQAKRDQKLEDEKRIIEEKRLRKEENDRFMSLRNTIAWVLAPNTRQVKKEYTTKQLDAIFEKHKELRQIQDELLAHCITEEEAEERIKKLNLSKKDEIAILSYHKTCWEISGTEEWSLALKEAVGIANAYLTGGLDAVQNDAVRERLVRWEEERN